MTSHFRTMHRIVPVAAVLAICLGFVAATPAFAADDGQENFFSAVLGMLGVNFGGDKNDGPPIDYRERAPIVLPPKMDLPQPLPPVTARTQAWPQDPELAKAKKAAEQAKAPRVTGTLADADGPISAEELRQRGTLAPNAAVPTGDCLEQHTCSPEAFWSMLKNTKKQDTEQVELAPGQEPAREYLTQPPPGYMTPTKVVKATAMTPRPQPDDNLADNPARYFLQQKENQLSPDTQ